MPANRPWRSRETLFVLVIAIPFLVFGIKTYRERRIIATSDRLKADMQIFALGINTYHAEEGIYPAPETSGDAASGSHPHLPTSLTSPIAYVSRLMTDPFAAEGELNLLGYLRRDDSPTTGSDHVFDAFVLAGIGEPVRDVDYVFWSRGPDGDLDSQIDPDRGMSVVRYDPTNGAHSNGDLLFWGPAIGVRRNPYVGTAGAGRGGLQ